MRTLRLSICLVACWCLTSADAFAQTTPTNVYQRASLVAAEINLIRLEMGVADTSKPDIAISNAQPREVYFQALTLFEKSNRLLFEQLREREDQPTRTSTDMTPDDVLALVDTALILVRRVKQSLGIKETTTIEPTEETHTPTDVYKLIVRLNRKLNTLLKQRFAPADVYQQLTYGVGLAATILATVSTTDRLGEEPAFVRRKTPVDVYRQLVSIYMILHETMELSGEKSLVIEDSESERNDVSPSDVYDLASLLVSELSYLHSLIPEAATPKDSYYPGDKLPSHVYQRTGRLESQVKALHSYISTHPTWLQNKR